MSSGCQIGVSIDVGDGQGQYLYQNGCCVRLMNRLEPIMSDYVRLAIWLSGWTIETAGIVLRLNGLTKVRFSPTKIFRSLYPWNIHLNYKLSISNRSISS
jgi:hypothetical protein